MDSGYDQVPRMHFSTLSSLVVLVSGSRDTLFRWAFAWMGGGYLEGLEDTLLNMVFIGGSGVRLNKCTLRLRFWMGVFVVGSVARFQRCTLRLGF